MVFSEGLNVTHTGGESMIIHAFIMKMAGRSGQVRKQQVFVEGSSLIVD